MPPIIGRGVFVRCASWAARATRATAGEPPAGLKVLLRFVLRRLRQPVLRLLDAAFGQGAGARFNLAVLRRSNASDAITPADVIRQETVESLVAGADEYYKSAIAEGATAFFKRKPFHTLDDSPQVLFRLGQLLHGAQLTKGLHVMEYGGGSGWLSAALWQMGCHVTCVDASAAALQLAREGFDERRSWIAWPDATAATAVADGHTIPLSNESVDRVICYDVLHHLPNPEEILRGFYRVLKQGGMACFCEPGRYHSATRASQEEMLTFRVLENDVVVEDVWRLAKRVGFTNITIRPVLDVSYSVSMERFLSLVEKGRVGLSGKDALMNGTASTSIFFLHKGDLAIDSRYASYLSGTLRVEPASIATRAGVSTVVTVVCTNTGQATWLARVPDAKQLGMVNVGIQLCDGSGRSLNRDWRRVGLPRDINPGESIGVACELVFAERGQAKLRVDLVSEGIAWFQAASTPAEIPVDVS